MPYWTLTTGIGYINIRTGIVSEFALGMFLIHKKTCGGLYKCVCLKFPGVCFCQELAKLDDVSLNYHKKGDFVFWDAV